METVGRPRVRFGFRQACLWGVLLAFPLLPAHGQDYEIRMDQPGKPGEKFRESVSVRDFLDLSMTSNGRQVRTDKHDITLEFEGVVQTLAVGSKGEVVKASATVEKFVKKEAGAATEVAPKGAVIVASLNDGKPVYQINGAPAGAETVKLLGFVVPLGGGPTDDEMFGTKERKKVGQSWNINSALAAKSLSEQMGYNVQDLTGKVTLDEVVHGASGDVLKISGHLSGKALLQPAPAGNIMDHSIMEGRFAGEVPTNPGLPVPTSNYSMKLDLAMHGVSRKGEPYVLQMKTETLKNQKTTLVK